MKLAGLDPGFAVDAAERRAALRTASDADLVAAVVRMALELRALGTGPFEEIAHLVGLPLGEVLASPFAARAVAIAAAVGASTVSHECRAAVPWGESAVDPAIADAYHGTWERGVLHAGKYRSFTQDEPFAAYNPNHMSKWGPHELLHRVCGFFWRPGLSRWELYLTARLNELVPVVLWYGLDEVARLDRDGFDRERDAADRDAPLGRARWWSEPESELTERVGRTVHYLREGLEHFEAETAAVDIEIAEGRRVPVPHPVLDASSDAVAYVVGHHPRLASSAQEALAAAVYDEALGIDDDVHAYRRRVEDCLDQLLFGPIEIDVPLALARRQARRVWDVAMRVAQHERYRPVRAGSALEHAGTVVRAAWGGDPSGVDGAVAALLDSMPSASREKIAATGLDDAVDEEHLWEGVRSVAPATAAALVAVDWPVRTLADAPKTRTDLPARIEPLVDALDRPWLSALYRFERSIAESVVRDDTVERLGELDLPKAGTVDRSSAFRLVVLPVDPTELHTEWQLSGSIVPESVGPPIMLLVGAVDESVSVVPAPSNVERLWARLATGPIALDDAIGLAEPDGAQAEGLPETGVDWVGELVAAGALLALPSV